MQMVKRSLILMSILILLFMSIPIRGNNFEDMDLQEYVEGFHPGWNLGNSLDAIGNETSWGNPRTGKELIDRIADAGFKSIRIPVTWGHRIGNAPDYEIDEDFLNRVEQIVQWSLDAGLYVILNMHHETSWIMEMEDNYDEVMAKFNSAWLQISDHFKDYSEGLLFEALNEPRFSNDWNEDRQVFFANLDDLHISFHEIVRNSGGYNDTRPLMISTMTGSTSQSRLDELSKTIEKLNDKNLVATFHYYGYWPFSVNVAGSTSFDFKAKKDIEDTFNRVYETFVTKGVPVIIGEYGLLGFDKSVDTVQRGESLKFFEYVNYYGQEKKMPLFLWDNGQHFDRRAMEWRDELLYDVLIASKDGRSSNALSDSIYNKENESIDDITLQMNFNGNDLLNISIQDKFLEEGSDYYLDNDKLIIKAELIEKLITNEYGVNAILVCEFSHGANWEMNLNYYNTAEVEAIEGYVNLFSIPVSFNGDRLLTMEAVYLSGGNAGSHSWTSYKEYNYDFYPQYDLDAIRLSKEFFAEVRDGEEVLLTIHFVSGETLKYIIVKDGKEVIGKPAENY